jgi:excisionase family DNA binding protein
MTTSHRTLNVPEKIDLIFERLGMIQELLERNEQPKTISQTLNLVNALALMFAEGYPMSKSSLYKLTSTGQIPFRRFGNKLIFDKDELMQWCKDKTSEANSTKEVIVNLAKAANKKINHGK